MHDRSPLNIHLKHSFSFLLFSFKLDPLPIYNEKTKPYGLMKSFVECARTLERVYVCALWLCLMITMWGIIANTCEPFPFAAMKSSHEKGRERERERKGERADSSPQHSFVPSPQHLERSEVTARRSMRSDTGVLFQKAGDMRGCLQQESLRIKRPARKLTEFLGSTILTS